MTTNERIYVEYQQWKLTQNIIQYMIRNFSHFKFTIYEFHNAMERLLMIMVQNKMRAKPPWTIYYPITTEDRFVAQFHSELIQKCGIGKCADAVVDRLIKSINNLMVKKCTNKRYKIIVTKTRVSYRSFTLDLPPKTINILSKYNRVDMIVMLMRYSAMVIKSQQWAVPSMLVKTLYTKYNIRFEGFASPINNYFSTLQNTQYCSIFDDDKKFGSIGNFFNTKLDNPFIGKINLPSIGWLVHPPCIPHIIHNAYLHICDSLSNAQLRNVNLTIVLIIPHQPDSELYRVIKHTHYKYTEIIYPRHLHFYENHGRYISSSFDTNIFIFDQTNDISKYYDIIDSMYIGNIPNGECGIPKPLKLFIDIGNFQSMNIVDRDDSTNIVTLNKTSSNKITWQLRYNKDGNNYIIKTCDISPIIVNDF